MDILLFKSVFVKVRFSMLSVNMNRSLLRTPKGYKAHQDITFNSVMANIHNDNILHTQICSKTQY